MKPEQPNNPRVFFALLPEKLARKNLQNICAQLPDATGNTIKAKNLHITLLFLGNIDQLDLNKLCKACTDITVKPFTLTIDKSGWWRKPKILWLAPSLIPQEILNLVNQLNHLAVEKKLLPETTKYFPHISLMRKVTHKINIPDLESFNWPAHEFCLMESITHSSGVEYKMLNRWPLNPDRK